MDEKSQELERVEKLLDSAHGIHRTLLLACAATAAVYWPKEEPFIHHCDALEGIEASKTAIREVERSVQPDTAVKWVCVVSGQGTTKSIWQNDGQSGAWLHGVKTRAPLEVVLEDLESSYYLGVPTGIWDSEMELGEAALARQMTTTFHALGILAPQEGGPEHLHSLIRRATLRRASCRDDNTVNIEVALDVREACAQLSQGVDVSTPHCVGELETECPKVEGMGLRCLDHYGVPGSPQYLVIHERKLDKETLVEREVDDRVPSENQTDLQTNIVKSLELRSNPLFDVVRIRSPQHAVHVVENDWLEQQRRLASRDNVMVASIPLPNVSVINVLLVALLLYLGVLVGEVRRKLGRASEDMCAHFDGYNWIGTSRGCLASWLFLISVGLVPFLALCLGRVGNRIAEKIVAGDWMTITDACETPANTWLSHSGWANDIGAGGLVLLAVSFVAAGACVNLWKALGHDSVAKKLFGPVYRLPGWLLKLFGLRLVWAETRAWLKKKRSSDTKTPPDPEDTNGTPR